MMYPQVLSTELLKLKRSRIPWILALAYCFAPLMLGLMMVVLKNPELGKKMGLITAKAQLTVGYANWPTYLMLTAYLFVVGLIVLAVVQAFVFGREYAEGTAKNLLTLPVGRGTIVTAKLTVSALWMLGMAMIVYGEALVIGLLIGLPGYAPDLLGRNAQLAAKLLLQAFLAGSIGAWFAVIGRGYLAPVGFSVLLLLLGDLFAHTGWGVWVPWSIVFMTAGAAGTAGANAVIPGPASFIVLVVFFIAATVATYFTLDRTDNTQ